MRRYDLQVHTDASPCSRAAPRDVVDVAVEKGLDGIAITNHDTLAGYEKVRERSPERLTVVPGVEVSTTQGHILALDVEDVPPTGEPLDVVDDIHDLGGLAILSHPFDWLRESFDSDLDELAAVIDAVEVKNSRCLFSRFNRQAELFAETHGLAVTGGSDAHFPMEIGRAVTLCDLPALEAIRNNETRTDGRGGYVSGHIGTKLNDFMKWFTP